MDPNEALKILREYVDRFVFEELPLSSAAQEHLIEVFDGLDGWLSKGGFLPDAWERKPIAGSPNRGLFKGDA